jgi:HAD superfamily hydrolase (TIGR01459 family)
MTMTAHPVPVLRGLSEIIHDYRAVLLDLWGVIHGGVAPYPHVLETLLELRRAGRPIALLSNAPRRAATVERRLAEIGVPREAYDALMTSGEAAHEALAARPDPDHAALGRRYVYIGPEWDMDVVADLDYASVGDVEEAHFLLCVGLFDEADPLESYDPLFAAAKARDLPMICVNPDLVVHRQSGITSPCAGLLARHYRDAHRGRAIYHGKPDPGIFRDAAAALDVPGDARILVVGDSLTTDIKGAHAAGYDSLFVTRGIHAGELGIEPGAEPDPRSVARLCARHGETPRAAIATLRW